MHMVSTFNTSTSSSSSLYTIELTEPSHADYAWNQRHRSTLSTPLPKSVMYKGNPRTPDTLSFEKIHYTIDDQMLTHLEELWLDNPNTTLMEIHERTKNFPNYSKIYLYEWIVAHLSSDATTGLRHEMNSLISEGVLKVKTNGYIVLEDDWEMKVPRMVLNEMKELWCTKLDVYNFYGINKQIKSPLESYWSEHGDEKDDEELKLRRDVFLENLNSYCETKVGMGEFGV